MMISDYWKASYKNRPVNRQALVHEWTFILLCNSKRQTQRVRQSPTDMCLQK